MKRYLVAYTMNGEMYVASVDSLDSIPSDFISEFETDEVTVVDTTTGIMYRYWEGEWESIGEVSGIATV